jgi:serine/threonine protein kinase
MVAVKKLFKSHTMDERMFQQEVTTMMSVKHPNIVRFIGYCSHTEQKAVQMTRKHILADERERLLCFDYISKGSLEDHVTGMKRLSLYCCKTSNSQPPAQRKKNPALLANRF